MQALGGAKNHMVVLPDADLDLAADAAVNAGFGSAGERCMAISVLVAVDPIGDELVAQDQGPDRRADGRPRRRRRLRDGAAGHQRAPRQGGCATWTPASPTARRSPSTAATHPVTGGAADGFWLGPTVLDHVTPEMGAYRDEIFGPVLSVVRAPTYAEALEIVNANPYGNGTAIFTNDGGAARRFTHEVEVGMVGVNVPIPVPMAFYSFGGWKSSLFGDTHVHGTEGVHFYTRGKAVTSRWLDPSHGGVNLGFPVNQ